ncbi:acyl carrier protein [Campylobacter sp.]|uniref:acyl carrier protein n=1 Tax=Campylobacter sp. TaxID=205 RepID=UPI002AA83FE0|nr:acyl carrier protein [Campylobacter sp.]MCI6660850.1 acyl carrier protein [Campylobacter sp.]MCI7549270.1 acyl carrier protein [Campylobacter sp.]
MSKEQIFEILQKALVELFEIESSKISLSSKIYEDLEIDSIDAIDLVDYIKKQTGYKMQASDFKEVKTLGDIVKIVSAQLEKNNI